MRDRRTRALPDKSAPKVNASGVRLQPGQSADPDWEAFCAFIDDIAPRYLSDEHLALVGKLKELK